MHVCRAECSCNRLKNSTIGEWLEHVQVRRVDEARYPMIVVASLSAVPQPMQSKTSQKTPYDSNNLHTLGWMLARAESVNEVPLYTH